MANHYGRRSSESANAYARFTHSKTARGIRPAGDATATAPNAYAAAMAAIQQGSTIANNIITQIGTTDRARLANEAEDRAARLAAQLRAADDTTRVALTNALNAANAQAAALRPQQGMSQGTMIALAVGGVAVLGGIVLLATRPRSNPTLFRRTRRGYRAKKFVPAGWLKRR